MTTKLARWRSEHKITLDDLADLTGLPADLLAAIDAGTAALTPETKVRMARSLRPGVRVADLFDVEVSAKVDGDPPYLEWRAP